MQTTTNLGLKKPDTEDFYNVQDMNDNLDIIDEKMQEVFLRGNEVKEGLVSKLVAMDIEADTSETFEELFDKMDDISTGVDTSGDTVVEGALLEGYTAHNANQDQITGTLPDKTDTANYSATASLDSTNSRLKMKIPALGRYGTSNYLYAAYSAIASLIGLTAAKLVKGNTILGITGNSNNIDTSSADAAASDIVSGKKAGVDGEIITGILPDASGSTVEASAVSQDDTYTYLDIPTTARYDTSSKIKTLNSNLGGKGRLIPIMTSTTQDGITVSCDGEQDSVNYPLLNAFDGLTSTHFRTLSSNLPHYIEFDFTKETLVTHILVAPYSPLNELKLFNYAFQIYENSEWVDVAIGACGNLVPTNLTQKYTKFRISITSAVHATNSRTYAYISQIQLFEFGE